MKRLLLPFCFCIQFAYAQTDSVFTRIAKLEGNVYFIDCTGGFGGGNVTASIGEDGILLADDLYASMTGKLKKTLDSISHQPVRIVLNSHFHGDHIQGNLNFRKSAVIIGHENIYQRLLKASQTNAAATGMLPDITFTDSLTIHFNGEDIRMIHFINSHTDSDAAIYFTKSKVLHLGDMFFFGMFPAVYTEGGGDIRQLVLSLEQILKRFPADAHVVPGHGNAATMKDLSGYTDMLKETISIVEDNLRKGKTLEQMRAEKVLAKYNALGDGGAQTTDQYLGMLYKLLSEKK